MALAALVAAGTWTAPVAADPIADKKAEAERLAGELEAQGREVSILAERLNQAQLKADGLAKQIKVAEAELAEAEKQVAAVRARLRNRAVASYIGGDRTGDLQITQLLASGSVNDLMVRRAYVSSIAGQERATVAMLDAAQEARRDQQANLEAAQSAAKVVLDDVAAQRTAAAKVAAERKATLDKVQGELKDLVAAEQARKAAEEARRVQAELAARQAREEAARAAAAAREREEAARRATTTSTPRSPSLTSIASDLGDAGGDATTGEGSSVGPPAPGAETAVAEAKRQLGKPYVYGASGPDSFDCSGLTSWAWKAGGRTLPHSSAAQFYATTRVSVSDIMPGDLVFYGSPIHHVGIYAGDGQMVEASETGTPVRMATIYRRDLVGVGRVR